MSLGVHGCFGEHAHPEGVPSGKRVCVIAAVLFGGLLFLLGRVLHVDQHLPDLGVRTVGIRLGEQKQNAVFLRQPNESDVTGLLERGATHARVCHASVFGLARLGAVDGLEPHGLADFLSCDGGTPVALLIDNATGEWVRLFAGHPVWLRHIDSE